MTKVLFKFASFKAAVPCYLAHDNGISDSPSPPNTVSGILDRFFDDGQLEIWQAGSIDLTAWNTELKPYGWEIIQQPSSTPDQDQASQ